MKDLFVPYDMAKKLKDVGFDEECLCVYNKRMELKHVIICPIGDNDYIKKDKHDDRLPAPLWQQVEQWFREKHQILIIHNSTPVFDKIHPAKYQSAISILFQPFKWTTGKYYIGDTFEEAREKAIGAAIKLIKTK